MESLENTPCSQRVCSIKPEIPFSFQESFHGGMKPEKDFSMQMFQYSKDGSFAPEATFSMHHTYNEQMKYNQQNAYPPQYTNYQNQNMNVLSSSEYQNQNYYMQQNQNYGHNQAPNSFYNQTTINNSSGYCNPAVGTSNMYPSQFGSSNKNMFDYESPVSIAPKPYQEKREREMQYGCNFTSEKPLYSNTKSPAQKMIPNKLYDLYDDSLFDLIDEIESEGSHY